MRAPEQRWQSPEQAASVISPESLGTAGTDIGRLLDRARDSLVPLDQYLNAHAARSGAAARGSSGFAGASQAAPLVVAGAAHGDFNQWRPPFQHGAAADALKLQSADAALLASASRRANPHGGGGAGDQHPQGRPFGVPQSPSAPDFGRPPSRSEVPSWLIPLVVLVV